MSVVPMNPEKEVLKRYANASQEREEALCCPVEYNSQYLKIIPPEILERDYGCGDPSRFVQEGETVLDLGSGGGKICYIISQIVGPLGRVIGVDFNPAMLELAEKYRLQLAEAIGWDNVTFRRGHIQDLKTDVTAMARYVEDNPIADFDGLQAFENFRAAAPALIENNSIDVIVSNCVLNLVHGADKAQLFSEMYRVLKTGGRVAISDIVSDEVVPEHMASDPELWSGCLSGAYQKRAFLRAFEEAGFHGIEVAKRDESPWRTVEGIEFRSITVTAYKGKAGPCMDHNQAVIYTGPWLKVLDDDGHTLERGERMAVCEKTFRLYTSAPYRDQIIPVPPMEAVDPDKASEFDCRRNIKRHPRETKGADFDLTTEAIEDCCGGGESEDSCCD